VAVLSAGIDAPADAVPAVRTHAVGLTAPRTAGAEKRRWRSCRVIEVRVDGRISQSFLLYHMGWVREQAAIESFCFFTCELVGYAWKRTRTDA